MHMNKVSPKPLHTAPPPHRRPRRWAWLAAAPLTACLAGASASAATTAAIRRGHASIRRGHAAIRRGHASIRRGHASIRRGRARELRAARGKAAAVLQPAGV